MDEPTPTPQAAKRTRRRSAAGGEAAKHLAAVIDSERRKIGHLAFSDLSRADVIEQMGELERLINEYMLLAYVAAGPGRRKKH